MTDEDSIRLRDRRWMWLTARIALWGLIVALSAALIYSASSGMSRAAGGMRHAAQRQLLH